MALDAVTVAGGAATFSQYGNLVHVGLSYHSILETMAIHVGDLIRSTKARKTKISEMVMSFYKTVGAEYGSDSTNLHEVEFDEESTPGLYTGDKWVEFAGDWKGDTRV